MIKYPLEKSEFEIQFQLYKDLLAKGFDARSEVSEGSSRFDIVIFKEKLAICIIEVKKEFRDSFRHQNFKKLRNQISKYQTQNLPVFVCHGIKEIGKTITSVWDVVNNKRPTHSKGALKKMKLRDAMTKSIQYKNWLNANSLANKALPPELLCC